MLRRVITIDGLSGVGKTELGKGLARETGFYQVSLGTFFWVITHHLLQSGLIPASRREDIIKSMERVEYEFFFDHLRRLRVVMGGTDVTEALMDEHLAAVGAQFASIVEVQSKVWTIARECSDQHPLIADGRVAGTIVFPDAFLKFLLHADMEIRIDRILSREQQLTKELSRDELRELVMKRQQQEESNHGLGEEISSDMMVIDTGQFSQEQVLSLALEYFHHHLLHG